jgi:hypothetical protein
MRPVRMMWMWMWAVDAGVSVDDIQVNGWVGGRWARRSDETRTEDRNRNFSTYCRSYVTPSKPPHGTRNSPLQAIHSAYLSLGASFSIPRCRYRILRHVDLIPSHARTKSAGHLLPFPKTSSTLPSGLLVSTSDTTSGMNRWGIRERKKKRQKRQGHRVSERLPTEAQGQNRRYLQSTNR